MKLLPTASKALMLATLPANWAGPVHGQSLGIDRCCAMDQGLCAQFGFESP